MTTPMELLEGLKILHKYLGDDFEGGGTNGVPSMLTVKMHPFITCGMSGEDVNRLQDLNWDYGTEQEWIYEL